MVASCCDGGLTVTVVSPVTVLPWTLAAMVCVPSPVAMYRPVVEIVPPLADQMGVMGGSIGWPFWS